MQPSARFDLRHAIVETAIELGSRFGEERLTMRQIAQRLGMSPTTLYYHFESKSRILEEVRTYGLEGLEAVCKQALGTGDLRAALTEASRAYVRYARENPWLYRVIMDTESDPQSMYGYEEAVRASEDRDDVPRGVLGRFHELIPGVRPPQKLIRFVGTWWAASHGVASLVIDRSMGANDRVFSIEDVDGFVDEALRGFVEALLGYERALRD